MATLTDGDFKYDVFLSHNSKDKPEVEQLAVKLRAEGLNPFLDKWHLPPGQNWQPLLADAQRNSQTFAIFLSPNEISPWHGEEAEYALSIQNAEKKKIKSLHERKRHVTLVLLPGNYSIDADYLENRTYADFRAGLDDPVAFAYLLAGIQGRTPIDVLTERGLAPGSSPEANSIRSGEARPALPPGSRLPHPPNPAFTGREAELQAIADALLDAAHANLLITQSVTGMGGLGKTQLAAEFCHRYGGRFTGVHWLNCQNPETVDSEIVECGAAMGLALPDTDLPAAVGLTLAAWRARGPRLIVLDNLEHEADLRLIRAKLQPGGDLRLLLTARNAVWPKDLVAQSLPLATFTPDESRAFLRRWLGDAPPDADLDALADRLGHLPLALHLAARYLHATRTKIPAYLDRLTSAFDDAALDNWQPEGGSATGHNLSLKASFLVSWEKIQAEDSRRLFLLAAWCAPNQPIPLALLARAAKLEEDALRTALLPLEQAGLLAYDPDDDRPSLHPLLAEFGRALDKDIELMTIFADALAIESNTAIETGLPIAFAPLRPHLEAFALLADAAGLDDAADLLSLLGTHLYAVADYSAAHPHFKRALVISEATFPPDHPEIAVCLTNLGGLLHELGDLPTARALLKRALDICQKTLGPDHQDTAKTMNNFASLLHDLGDLPAALTLFERALSISEVTLGRNHLTTAIRLNNLARLLHDIGDLPTAHQLYIRALSIRKNKLGLNHPLTAQSYSNLGLLLITIGDFHTAQQLLIRAVDILETQLPPNHPDTELVRGHLAKLNAQMGKR